MTELELPIPATAAIDSEAAQHAVTAKRTRKGQANKKPSKATQDAELIEKLVGFLDGQRRLGGDAYPIKLGQLLELAGASPTHPDTKRVVGSNAFKDRVLVPAKKSGKGSELRNEAPVVLRTDAEVLVKSAAIVDFAFHVACRTTKARGFTIAQLKGSLGSQVQAEFSKAVKPTANEYRLPPTCAVVRTARSEIVFRLADMITFGGQPPTHSPTTVSEQQQPAPATNVTPRASIEQSGGDFATDFPRAFHQLNLAQGQTNFVKLLDLRRALPQYDRGAFDEGLRQLRFQRLFTLDSHEGNSVRLTDEEREAGIREGSSLLVYCRRKQ